MNAPQSNGIIDLTGQRILVTGSARRIGRAIALALADAGAVVIAHYNTTPEAEVLRGPGIHPLQADLADPAQAEELLARAEELDGPLNAIVNNASMFPTSTLADVSVEQIHANLQVNALSPFILARAFAARGRCGSVVNLLDSRMVLCDAKHVAYHLSKRMLFTLTRMMALEFAPGIRVNAVAPGPILAPPGKDEAYLHRVARQNPMGTWGTPQQIADAVLFLLRNAFITGQVLFVDGGLHMKGHVYGC